MQRRNFLLVPFLGAGPLRKPEQHFHHDNVLGTSMEFIAPGTSSIRSAAAARKSLLAEIARLCKVVSTYDPASEISRLGASRPGSSELTGLLDKYAYWERFTGGAVTMRPAGALNMDALGKAFVIEKALAAARRHVSSALLNIGGDILASGPETWTVGVADPVRWHENAPPLTTLEIRNMAVATSGNYERGDHIRDPRTGLAARQAVGATVIARDIVTANALATALCILKSREGLDLVASVHGAECLTVLSDGTETRSAGFSSYERARLIRTAALSTWPQDYELSIAVTLKPPTTFARRPYVAVWAEDAQGKVVRNIAVWASRPRWLNELHTWWADNRGNDVNSMTRATRPPGRYRLTWDGVDDKGQPAPPGIYTIFVESNREHGTYAKESGTIACGAAKIAQTTLKANSEFEAVEMAYGPRGQTA